MCQHISYNSVFLSHISYGITSCGFNMCTRVIKLQTKVIRFLTNSTFNSHTAPLFKQLGQSEAVDIFKLACFKLLYKYENRKLPIYFNGMFVLQHDNVVIRPKRINRTPPSFNNMKKSVHTTMSAISQLNPPIQSSAVFVLGLNP